MDASALTPFMQSVQNVFATMLQLDVTIGQPSIKEEASATYDVSGIIGLSGDVVGSVVLSFPVETAERVVALFTGESLTSADEDFADGVGELVNMVSGGAKAMLEGRKISISVPSVVVGKNHTIARQKVSPCVRIPCECDCGEFVIEVCMQEQSEASAGGSAGAAQGAAA